ncbi:MAG TPA: hypothetical protein VG164_02370 [Trebonia sp.]|nr:hypothetical protein [Trebonia sp.]
MTSRNRRGNRQGSLKARLGIATAVLVGGGAIGVAVAASGHGGSTSAQSTGYTTNSHHMLSEGSALSSALSTLSFNQGRSVATLSRMAPMRTFSQVRHGHKTFGAQRGIVELATKKFLLVKSFNGSLHLWWLAHTKFVNAGTTMTGMTALTGNWNAASSAMRTGNMVPATVTVAGSTLTASTMTAPAVKPVTITVGTGTTTVTIVIAQSTATVTAPMTTPVTTAGISTTSVSPMISASGPMVSSRQPAFTRTRGVVRGDLVLVTGFREHGFLVAKLALFTPPATTVTPSPSATPTISTTPTMPGTPTVSPTSTASVFTGTHS